MNWGRVYVGSVIIAVGVVLLLDNVGTFDAGEVFGTWWPVLVIVAGLLMFIANPSHWAPPAIVTAVGIALLLSTLDVVDVGDFIWPTILVAVGLVILFGLGSRGRAVDAGNTVSHFTAFSGTDMASRSQGFQGGSLSVLFGGIDLDLRNAELASHAEIESFTAFGATSITVPTGWQVDLRGFPIFGGFENATAKEDLDPSAPILVVSATVLFGAVEVTH